MEFVTKIYESERFQRKTFFIINWSIFNGSENFFVIPSLTRIMKTLDIIHNKVEWQYNLAKYSTLKDVIKNIHKREDDTYVHNSCRRHWNSYQRQILISPSLCLCRDDGHWNIIYYAPSSANPNHRCFCVVEVVVIDESFNPVTFMW